MDKIVQQGLKVDFHIHSSASSKKDDDLVKDGTIENIPVLLSKLQENSIDMFAITDHDRFDYCIYHELKKHEGNEFKKILPGVEFSVGIEALDKGKKIIKQVHVIAIFDDSDDEKTQKLETLLNSQKYDVSQSAISEKPQMFSEKTFREILQNSEMNVCLIAHQKNSPTSTTQHSPDAKALGEEKFNELLNYGYFEAYEFKTENTHVFHSLFKMHTNENYERVRFITGSDCHQWDAYPRHDMQSSESEMLPTYLKCLPTFRGLAMALTDDTRIQCNSNFFSNTNNYLKSIDYTISGTKYSIPLSRGVNAIIGDNSKGKSMFLHALTDYLKLKEGKIAKDKKKEYTEYLKKKEIKIEKITKDLSFQFDSQGEIRKSFEDGDFFSNSLMQSFRPKETNSSDLKSKLINCFQEYYDALTSKFSYSQKLSDFLNKSIDLNVEPSPGVSLHPTKIPETSFEKNSSEDSIVKNLNSAVISINEALKTISDSEDKKALSEALKTIEFLVKKYKDESNLIKQHNKIKECINSSIEAFINWQKALQNNEEIKWSTFESSSDDFADKIAVLIRDKSNIKPFQFSFEKFTPEYNFKILNDVKLVSRFSSNREYYDSSFCKELLSNVVMQGTNIDQLLDIPNLDKEQLLLSLKDKDEIPSSDPVDMLKAKIDVEIDKELQPKQVIIEKDKDITASYSAGFNAAKYLAILAHDMSNRIYIIDQPEDDISQPSIKDTVVKDLKTMSKNKQIILVTHNPQFVVNLDVDNVIYFHDTKEGKLQIDSGALEYQDENIDVLNVVSENLDGGVDSLRKRWKRYEKAITD